MNTVRNNERKYIILELLAIAFLATGGILVKISALSPINTGFYRVLFSIPILFPLAYKHLNQLNKKNTLTLLLAGVFLAGDISLWNLSFHYTSIANANLLTNLTPFTVIPFSYFIFKEKIPKFFLLGTVLTIVGVFILIAGKTDTSGASYFGDFLSLSASIFYAGFLLISYRLSNKLSSSVIMLVSSLGSVITLLITSSITEGLQVPHGASQLLPILGLTLFLQVIGHNLLAHCQGKINVNLSSVICLSQPAIASFYGFIILSERISIIEVLGIVIIIVGIYSVKKQYNSNPPNNTLYIMQQKNLPNILDK